MGPIRRSMKRKPEPAAPEAEARDGKPIRFRFLLRASERLQAHPQSSAAQLPVSSDAKPVDGGPQLTTGRKNSPILQLPACNDVTTAPRNQSRKFRDKSRSYLNSSVKKDVLLGPLYPDLLGCKENDQIQCKRRHFPEEKVKQRNAVLLEQSSVPLLSQSSTAGFGHFEYDPKLYPDFDSAEGSKGFTDEMNCYERGKKGHKRSVRETKKSVAISEDLTNMEDDLLPPMKSCQAINHDHHPFNDNVASVMECETSCVVATENMSVMPVAMISDVVPNLLPSNATSDISKTGHQGHTGSSGNMATANTQISTKKFAAEEQQGSSLEHQDQASPMKEYAAESSQSISKSEINQLFSTDIRNTTEAEHGNRLTTAENDEGTMSMCVASGADDSYCTLLQRYLIVHESTVADRSSESLAIENTPFLKTSPMWAHIEEMEIFKKVPQRPHFHPFKQLGSELVEAMALGLMVFFANTAESIKNLNIQDESELFKEKMKGLCLLEKHGFDVGKLRSRLETLLLLKNSCRELHDAIKKLEEKITLKEMDGRQRGIQISMLYTATRQLERQAKLFRCILKSSVSQQNTDALEISSLKTEACDLEQSYRSMFVEQQFSSIVSAQREAPYAK